MADVGVFPVHRAVLRVVDNTDQTEAPPALDADAVAQEEGEQEQLLLHIQLPNPNPFFSFFFCLFVVDRVEAGVTPEEPKQHVMPSVPGVICHNCHQEGNANSHTPVRSVSC